MSKEQLLHEIEKLSLYCLDIENNLTGQADFREEEFPQKVKHFLKVIRSQIDGLGLVVMVEGK